VTNLFYYWFHVRNLYLKVQQLMSIVLNFWPIICKNKKFMNFFVKIVIFSIFSRYRIFLHSLFVVGVWDVPMWQLCDSGKMWQLRIKVHWMWLLLNDFQIPWKKWEQYLLSYLYPFNPIHYHYYMPKPLIRYVAKEIKQRGIATWIQSQK